MKKPLIFIALIAFATIAHATQYNVNTITALKTAISNAIAGDVILIEGGEYTFTSRLDIKNKSGTAPIKSR